MKQSVFVALAALACSAALAQAPAGTTPRPPSQVDPAAAGGAPAAKAEMRKDAKTGAMPMAAGGGAMPMAGGAGMGMGSMAMMKSMDTNGDGMISKKEFDTHHKMMWNKMKPKKGMVSMADMEAMMKGGPN